MATYKVSYIYRLLLMVAERKEYFKISQIFGFYYVNTW